MVLTGNSWWTCKCFWDGIWDSWEFWWSGIGFYCLDVRFQATPHAPAELKKLLLITSLTFVNAYLQVDIDDSSMVTDWPRSWRKCHVPIIWSLVSAYGLCLTGLLVHWCFQLTLDIPDMFYVHRQIALVDASCTTQILLVSRCTSYWNHIMWISCSFFLLFCLSHMMEP